MKIFFIRRYNDIDHIVPIVYRMAKDGIEDIEVYCTNLKINLKKDARLNLLKDNFNLKIEYYHFIKFNKIPYIYTVFARLILFYNFYFNRDSIFAKKFLNRLYSKKFINKYFSHECSLNLIDNLKPDVVILDWQKTQPVLESFCKVANQRNIPIIAVPHGLSLGVSQLLTFQELSLGFGQDYGKDWRYFNYSIVQFEMHKDRVVRGNYNKNQVPVLGSSRYCDEWMNYLDENQSPKKYGVKNNNINIVYMDHRLEYRFYKEIVVESINKLSRIEGVNLVVKPTTGRTHKSDHRDELGILNSSNSKNIIFEETVSSSSLIDWADVVIGTISSIGIEVLLKNKILIHPKYFHGNELLYEKMNSCWVVNSYKELESAIDKVKQTPGYRPYSQKDVDKFIDYVVYGGIKDRDVLGDYKNFILSKI
jgi:hypothetical protein